MIDPVKSVRSVPGYVRYWRDWFRYGRLDGAEPRALINTASYLYVAEHIGLGRYGDPLDPHGTRDACRELARVLAPGGNLHFSLPVGKPRRCFNAHRIHAVGQILEYFQDLALVELSGIDDNRKFRANIGRKALDHADYGCGLFHFTKK